ncbi:uncharacterized protein BKA78DRAFT_86820 [Phyllosticta capitalensis]|uniref:uncharacterized protein n=1 Tax=Phyllosticta capitalensis TaxID=121624 RepID=UPI00312FC882
MVTSTPTTANARTGIAAQSRPTCRAGLLNIHHSSATIPSAWRLEAQDNLSNAPTVPSVALIERNEKLRLHRIVTRAPSLIQNSTPVCTILQVGLIGSKNRCGSRHIDSINSQHDNDFRRRYSPDGSSRCFTVLQRTVAQSRSSNARACPRPKPCDGTTSRT